MLRTLSVLTLSGLLATTVSAAPSTCSGARFLDSATGTCQPCVGRTVKTCSSATVATSCVSRYYLTSDGRCVSNGQCPDATFADKTTSTCAKCYSLNYKTCSSASATAATSCMNNTCLPATGGRCLPLARIASTSYCTPAGTVAACPETGVKTCKIDGTPLSCASPYFLNPATAATAAACVPALECPTGTFADESTRTCTPCGEGASRCTVEGADQCYDGWFLLDKKCYNPCPDGYQGQDGGCAEIPTSRCSIQTDYFNPFTNLCTDVCPDTASFTPTGSLPSTYPDEASMTCSACQGDNIYRCDQTTGFAAQCVDGFFLLEGGCFASCPEGMKGRDGACVDQSACPEGLIYEPYTRSCSEGCYASAREMNGVAIPAEYLSEDGKTCLACKSENARECDQTTGLASSCIDGYFLLEGQCYSTCPEGMKGLEGACVDQLYCPYGFVYEPYTKQCVEGCYDATEVNGIAVPAEYISDDRQTCLVCKSQNAKHIDGYYFLDGQCYAACPEGYKADEGKCIADVILGSQLGQVSGAWTYMGCGTYPLTYLSTRGTIEDCLADCEAHNAAVCGLGNGDNCYYSAAPAGGLPAYPVARCSNVCSGNSNQWCGGSGFLAVWWPTSRAF
ncbi:hypothetical protein JCM6882_007337 [Rhodosporidiobolus microsporus]